MRRVMNRILFLITMITATVAHADDDYGVGLTCDTMPELCESVPEVGSSDPSYLIEVQIKSWNSHVEALATVTESMSARAKGAPQMTYLYLDEIRRQNRILIEQNNVMIRLIAEGAK